MTWLTTKKKKKKKNEESNMEHKQDFQKLNNTYKNYHKIYTDASKTKHGIGFAIVTENTTKKQRLSNHTSILTAETYAILEALRYIQKKQIPISGNLHRFLDFDKRDNKLQYHQKARSHTNYSGNIHRPYQRP